MTTWQTAVLGVAAFSLLISAFLQAAVFVALFRSVGIAKREYADLKAQVAPLLDQLQSLTGSLSQTAEVLVTQVHRVESMVTETVETVATIRDGVRDTAAVVSSHPIARAVMAAFGWGRRVAPR